MDILYLVDRLENLIAGSRKMPLVHQILIKEGDILNIVDQMRTSIPDEIKQARRIIQEKERILAQAQADATTLLSKAREESERAMNREGLLRAAEEHREHMKLDADGYVAETLRNLKDHLASIEMDISRTILSIEKGLESLEIPEEEGEEELEVYYEESEGSTELEDLPVRPVPRRASLANDTQGGPVY